MFDPWIIEEIRRQEEERIRRQYEQQPFLEVEDRPARESERRHDKSQETPEAEEKRGVLVIDFGK